MNSTEHLTKFKGRDSRHRRDRGRGGDGNQGNGRSFPPKTFFSPRRKRRSSAAARKASGIGVIFQTASIGTIYGMLYAGLLLMPFQSHRTTAFPSAEDNYDPTANTG